MLADGRRVAGPGRALGAVRRRLRIRHGQIQRLFIYLDPRLGDADRARYPC